MIELDDQTKTLMKCLLLALYEEANDEVVVDEEINKERQITNGIRFGHRNAYLTVADRLGISIRSSEHTRDLFAEAMNSVSYEELHEEFGR